ncbi:MAG: bifunctional diguanylate cyclase/phosphodiesterase [Actinomyces sp.]|nr:MAG: bifunctional diguanylate cyclase/phosphodiesterase [Actinomyces sp.]
MNSWDRRLAASRNRELLDPAARRRRLRQLGLPDGLHPDDEAAVTALLRLAERREEGFAVTVLGRVVDDPAAANPLAATSGTDRLVRIGIVGHAGAARVLVHDDADDARDPVSGLPGRRWAIARIAEALAEAHDTSVGVYLVDVDRFKAVNDRLGHATGDRVLRRLARLLGDRIRSQDHLAHLGGDDYVVVSPDVEGPAEALTVAERLRSAPEGLDRADPLAALTLSVGVALATHAEAAPDELLGRAETAVHQAKSLGRDRVALYDRTLEAAAARSLDVDSRLRRALEDDAIEVRYQPIVELASGRVAAVEALLRVAGDDGHPLDPRETVAAAEDGGLIRRIEESVLERAARTIRALPDVDEPVVLSMNVSERRLADSRFPLVLARLLHLADLPAEQVRLEIGSTMIEHLPSLPRLVAQLRTLGVGLALDGVESLPDGELVGGEGIDQVKLSRRLVQGVHDDRVRRHLELLVGDLHARGVELVAVGVETDEDLAAIRELGVRYGQGYLWAPPETGRRLAERLVANAAAPL